MSSRHQHQPEPVCQRGHVKPEGRGRCKQCLHNWQVEHGHITGYKTRLVERSKDPMRTCRSGKHVIGVVGTMANGGCHGCWRERTGHKPTEFNGMCRKNKHRLFGDGKLTNMAKETPRGFTCRGCERQRAAERRRREKTTHRWVTCFASAAVVCRKGTRRPKTDTRLYLCPEHRANTPAVVVKLLRLQGDMPLVRYARSAA